MRRDRPVERQAGSAGRDPFVPGPTPVVLRVNHRHNPGDGVVRDVIPRSPTAVAHGGYVQPGTAVARRVDRGNRAVRTFVRGGVDEDRRRRRADPAERPRRPACSTDLVD